MHKKIWSGLTVAVLVLLWQTASFFGLINPLFLPTPAQVAETVWIQVFVTGELIQDILATLARFLAGYFIAIIIGIIFGLLMGYFARVYDALEFLVDFCRSVPSTALYPLFLLVTGIGEESKIAVVIWSTSLIVIVNTMYGVKHASKMRLLAAKTMKANQWTLFTKVIIPDALPHIFAGMRIAIGIGLIVIIAAEMFIGTTVGLGKRIIDSQISYRIPEMYAAIIIAGIMGYTLNQIFIKIEQRAIHWSGK